MFIGFCQFIVIGWIYGADRLCNDIKNMLGYNVPRIWMKISWKIIGPLFTLVIMIYSLIKYKPLTYDRNNVYPVWANVLGWFLALSSMLWLPGTAIYKLVTAEGDTLKEKFQSSIKPEICDVEDNFPMRAQKSDELSEERKRLSLPDFDE